MYEERRNEWDLRNTTLLLLAITINSIFSSSSVEIFVFVPAYYSQRSRVSIDDHSYMLQGAGTPFCVHHRFVLFWIVCHPSSSWLLLSFSYLLSVLASTIGERGLKILPASIKPTKTACSCCLQRDVLAPFSLRSCESRMVSPFSPSALK